MEEGNDYSISLDSCFEIILQSRLSWYLMEKLASYNHIKYLAATWEIAKSTKPKEIKQNEYAYKALKNIEDKVDVLYSNGDLSVDSPNIETIKIKFKKLSSKNKSFIINKLLKFQNNWEKERRNLELTSNNVVNQEKSFIASIQIIVREIKKLNIIITTLNYEIDNLL